MSKLIKKAEECPACHDPNAYYSIDGIECPNLDCKLFSPWHYNELSGFKEPLIEQLIELADALDSMGYVKLADKVDNLIVQAFKK